MSDLPSLDALAFSLHHTRGVYALLVGSGLSTAAGIPTGWKITVDLIQKLKKLAEPDCEENNIDEKALVSWYQEKYNKEPDYSDLLDKVAKPPSERQLLIKKYIEHQDGQASLREPTEAHFKIAKLVKSGKIKVIITTNFDQLLERALNAEGITPQIIDNDDSINGAKPIVHEGCTLIKVHGDYMDARIKNTKKELEQYSAPLNNILDQVFDAFGLIVVGWSGEWDDALYSAIKRTPSRRYSFYWAAYQGDIGDKAKVLIEHRDGRVIDIESADKFFKELGDKVEVLDRTKGPHPYNVSMALGLAKKYCRDDQYSMEWAELLHKEVERVKEYVTSEDYPFHPQNNNLSEEQKIKNLVDAFVARTEILRRACLICGRWGTDKANREAIEVIRSLVFEELGINGVNFGLRKFGASLCFYWHAIGIIEAKNWLFLKELFYTQIKDSSGVMRPLVYQLPPQCWDDFHSLCPQNSQNKNLVREIFLGGINKETKDIALSGSRVEQLHLFTEFYIAIGYIIAQQDIRGIEIDNSINNYTQYNKPLWLFKLRTDDGRQYVKLQKKKAAADDQHFEVGLLCPSKQRFESAVEILENLVVYPY